MFGHSTGELLAATLGSPVPAIASDDLQSSAWPGCLVRKVVSVICGWYDRPVHSLALLTHQEGGRGDHDRRCEPAHDDAVDSRPAQCLRARLLCSAGSCSVPSAEVRSMRWRIDLVSAVCVRARKPQSDRVQQRGGVVMSAPSLSTRESCSRRKRPEAGGGVATAARSQYRY